MNIRAFIQPLRTSLDMIPRELWLRLALTVPLNLAVATLESASAGAIYFLVKIVGEPNALRTMTVGTLLRRIDPTATHKTLVLTFTGLLALFYFVKVIFTVWATVSSRRALKNANIRVASMFFRAYLVAPYSIHARRNSAEVTAQINREIPDTLNGVVTAYMQLFLEVVVGAGLLITMFVAAPQVTLTLLVITGLTLYLLLRWTRAKMQESGTLQHVLQRQKSRRVSEGLGAIKEIKVLSRESYFLDRYTHLVESSQELQLRRTVLDALPRVVIEAVFAAAGLTAIALFTLSQKPGANVVPLMGLYAYGAFRLIPTANRLTLSLGELRWRKGPLERIHQEYLDLKVRVATGPIDRSAERAVLQDRLAFEQVSFRYDDAAPFALRELSFAVNRGQSVGIVGATGAGKSTVIDLLLGLIEPLEGRITADGTDLQQLGARWRRSIGYVPQHIFLCDDTVRRNVALGIDEAELDDERVWAALRMAQLEEFVRSLPGQLDAEVGERGTRLSGGQRQRIGIARALYHDPEVLVFDEATSSLDVTTEAELTRAVESLLGVKTMIIVAHRLSTVQRCDKLFLLANGRLQASGTYDELVNGEPMFRRMALATTE